MDSPVGNGYKLCPVCEETYISRTKRMCSECEYEAERSYIAEGLIERKIEMMEQEADNDN